MLPGNKVLGAVPQWLLSGIRSAKVAIHQTFVRDRQSSIRGVFSDCFIGHGKLYRSYAANCVSSGQFAPNAPGQTGQKPAKKGLIPRYKLNLWQTLPPKYFCSQNGGTPGSTWRGSPSVEHEDPRTLAAFFSTPAKERQEKEDQSDPGLTELPGLTSG